MLLLFSPEAVKLAEAPLLTTIPPPNASAELYTVPSIGVELNELEVLLTTRYSLADDAVNEPAILFEVTVPKTNTDGCEEGATQLGNKVA